MNNITYPFARGISRIEGVGPERPYSMTDCEVVPAVGLDAVADTRVYTPSGESDAAPNTSPWYQAPTGRWYDGDDASSAESLRAKFYVHQSDGEDAPDTDRYTYKFLEEDGTAFVDTPACCLKVLLNTVKRIGGGDGGNYTNVGVAGGTIVEYRGVPIDKYGQSGPVCHWGVPTDSAAFNQANVAGGGSGGAEVSDGFSVSWGMLVTNQTSYIDVYKRKQSWALAGNNIGNLRPESDTAYYYMGRFSVVYSVTGGGGKIVDIIDDNCWIDRPVDPESTEDIGDAVGPVYDEPANVWNQPIRVQEQVQYDYYTLIDMLRHPHARVMYNHAGVFLHGNVSWPTKKPALTTGPFLNYDVVYQLEYTTPRGPVYGQVSVGGPDAVNMGEAALIVWAKHTDGKYYFYERIVADAGGHYPTTRFMLDNTLASWYTGRADRRPTFDKEYFTAHGVETSQEGFYPATQYIDEPDTVLASVINRPYAITFAGFNVPDGSRVTALVPMRQAEEDNLKSYDFYCFSERGSYVVSRSDTDFVIDSLLFNVGCKLGPHGPLVATTKQGVVFVGTDNRVYLGSGRTVQTLDDEVASPEIAEPLFTAPTSLAYFPELDRVVLTTETGVWMFSFQAKSWSAHLSGDFSAVQYDRVRRALLLRGSSAVVIWDGKGEPRTEPSVTTQTAYGVTTFDPYQIRADFDPQRWSRDNAAYVNGNREVTTDPTGCPPIGSQVRLGDAGRSSVGVTVGLTCRVAGATGTGVVLTSDARRTGFGRLDVDRPLTVEIRSETSTPDEGYAQTAVLSRGRVFWPTIRGYALRLTLSGFRRLRSAVLAGEGEAGED